MKLIPGELLDAGGFVSQVSSGKPQWFSYTLRGSGTEVWHPRFSYYGFPYVQLETAAPNDGFPQQPRLESVQGQFIHADVPVVGQFRCSDELLNRIHRLIDAAILSNTQPVLTDCLNVKSKEERRVYKKLNSAEVLIQRQPRRLLKDTCITSA